MKLLQSLTLATWVALTGNAIPATANDAAVATSAEADMYTPFNASELENLFRLDHMVESVTLLVARPYGSSSVIVVTPDGTKWYASRHPENVGWVDGMTGDIITIKNPTPGPYQLLGELNPGSTIERVSSLSVELDPLPQPLYQGERVKVTARFLGDEQLIRMPGLEYMIEWRAGFTSLRKPDEQNYVSGTFPIGSYTDSGEYLDEEPDDGIFTAELNLRQEWGSYTFSVTAANKIFERQINMPIYLSPAPVQLEIVAPQDPTVMPWKLRVNVDDTQVIPSDTVVHLEYHGPNGKPQTLLLDQLIPGQNDVELVVDGYGGYRITGSIASTSVGGRGLVLSMNDLFFNNPKPPPPPPDPRILAQEEARKAALQAEAEQQQMITWVIVGNVVVLLIGGVGIIIWRKRQTLTAAMNAAQQRVQEEKKKQASEEDLDDADSLELDDLDLAMPDTDSN